METERAVPAGPVPVIASPSPPPIPPPAPLIQPTVVTAAVAPVVAQPSRSSSFRKRLIVYSIATILTICAFLALLSRQSARASQSKRPAPSPSVRTSEPVTHFKPVPPAQPNVVTTIATPTAVPTLNPTVDETALLGQIKSAWQVGAYTRATRLVNQILTENPASAEARMWKKKIRSSQDAEEEMK